MPYFHNCQYGIVANNKSYVYTDVTTFGHQFTSIPGVCFYALNGSVLNAPGATPAGTSFNIVNCEAGVVASQGCSINLQYAQMSSVRNGILVNKQTTIKFDNCTIAGKYDYVNSSHGVLLDASCVGTVYGTSVTGFTGGTGGPSGGHYKSINSSILYNDSVAQKNLVNVSTGSIIGYAIADTTKGAGDYGGFGSSPPPPAPPGK